MYNVNLVNDLVVSQENTPQTRGVAISLHWRAQMLSAQA